MNFVRQVSMCGVSPITKFRRNPVRSYGDETSGHAKGYDLSMMRLLHAVGIAHFVTSRPIHL